MVAIVLALELVLLATTGCSVAFRQDGGKKSPPKKHAKAPRYTRLGGFNQTEATMLLEMHNKFRASQNASNMLIMEWNTDLQKSAQDYADRCDFTHSPASYTANIGGFKVVWHNSYALGCGIRLCKGVKNASPTYSERDSYLVVCHYGPNGNFRYAWPYRKGEPCSECDKKKTPFCIRGMC
ncbi:cysteine-rich venom protein, partial [Elysia marginata]